MELVGTHRNIVDALHRRLDQIVAGELVPRIALLETARDVARHPEPLRSDVLGAIDDIAMTRVKT